jgi:hypothetical protein
VPVVLAEIIRRFDWKIGYRTSFRPMVSGGTGMDESHEPIILTPIG